MARVREKQPSVKKSKREALRQQRQRQRRLTYLIVGVVVVAALAGLGFLLANTLRAPLGEAISEMADTSHVAEGTDPGPYNSDPPTSGRHYPGTYPAGFYDQADLEALPTLHEGFLVHNLEHGYVILWYNCALLDEEGCSDLKAQIRSVIDEHNALKVIAFPRDTLQVPVVMTSWGRLMQMDEFDQLTASRFISANRNKAPEPFAP